MRWPLDGGDFGCGRGHRRERLEGDGLDWKARPEKTDLTHGAAGLLRDDLRHRQRAVASLARAHAAARVRLHAVGAGIARECRDIACRDFFAAARERIAAWNAKDLGGPIQRIEKSAPALGLRQL